ncbi:hypothetical protein GPS55_13855, partial [Acinetobacter haemolyticus]|nr:hypothetical protein [Acinetobacter haemolyticus]
MAVSEIAKGNTKSKSKTVTVGSVVVAIIGAVTFSPNAMGATGTSGGTGSGTAISSSTGTSGGGSGATYCGTGSTQAFTGTGTRTIAIGCDARAEGTNSAIADRSNPYNTTEINPRVNYGTSLVANLAIGTGAFSGGNYTDVNGTTQTVSQATAIGSWATAQHISAIAIGTASLATGNTSLAVGRQSVASGDYAQALGNVSAATGTGSLAIGHSATATGYRGIAIGAPDIATAAVVAGQQGAAYQTVGYTLASGKDSIAFGGGAQATQENALSIGAFSKATGTKSVAIGTGAEATEANALVIGENAKTAVAGGVALGMDAQVVGENSVAVGKGSIAVAQSGSSFLTNVAADTTAGTISFGNSTTKRRLTNLADGSAASDAVTVAQLTHQNTLSNKQGEDTAAALGGGSTYNSTTGAVSLPSYNVGGTTQTTVAGAINNIDSRTTSLENQTWKLNTNSDTATTIGKDVEVKFSDGKNIKITRSGADIVVATTDSVTFDSVTTGNSKLDNSGLTIAGGPSITTAGIDAGSKVITNVADGSAPGDAVNFGQLTTTNDNVAQNTTDIATNTANITTNTNNIATNTSDITTLKGGFNLQTNGANSGAIKAGDTVDIGVVDPADTNLTATKTGNNVAFALSQDLNLTTVTTGNSKLDTNGLVVTGGPSVTTAGIDAGSKVITNVADGSAPNDAVNFGQLTTTNNNVAQNTTDIATNTANITTNTSNIATNTSDITTLKGGFNLQTNGANSGAIKAGDTVDIGVVDPADTNLTATKTGNNVAFALSQDLNLTTVTTGNSKLDTNGLVVTGGPSVTTAGIDAGSKVITNVADGSAPNDAVNFGQLTTTNNNVA